MPIVSSWGVMLQLLYIIRKEFAIQNAKNIIVRLGERKMQEIKSFEERKNELVKLGKESGLITYEQLLMKLVDYCSNQ